MAVAAERTLSAVGALSEPEPSARTTLERLVASIGPDHPPDLGDRLGEALSDLATQERSAATGAYFQRLLDARSLDMVQDSRGISCRAAVVDALLTLGYPWALQVHPEDLDLFRTAHAQPGARVKVAMGVVSVVGGIELVYAITAVALLLFATVKYAFGDDSLWALLFAVPFVGAMVHGYKAIRACHRAGFAPLVEDRAQGRTGLIRAMLVGLVALAVGLFGAAMISDSFFAFIPPLLAAPAVLTGLGALIAGYLIPARS